MVCLMGRFRGVVSELEMEQFESNTIVFQINEVGRKVYFILQGELAVLVEKKHLEAYEPRDHFAKLLDIQFPNLKVVTIFGKGAYFGEVSLLHRVPRTATVR